ncbi:MAG: ImmA/IrrE family metallo-endopeptidase [Deltaproteobacteria bacterium]|nr:ImmA/IrrE family metallo-endopeptidase [Deltaproteobacteria bacterium]
MTKLKAEDMGWEGLKIKMLIKDRGWTLQRLATKIGVSRQSVTDWINGQIPKGHHLISLSQCLGVTPADLFTPKPDDSISVPAHRKRGSAKIKPATTAEAFKLAKEYKSLFFNDAAGARLTDVWKLELGEATPDPLSIKSIAQELRSESGISPDNPMNYRYVFKMLDKLGLVVIFRNFHEPKTYAFYSKIYGRHVIFVNTDTNIMDLIFALLHEAGHALLDRNGETFSDEDESVCDHLAGYVQFPDSYVDDTYESIKGLTPGEQINKLKYRCRKYGHSLHGVVTKIKGINPVFDLSVHGADTNLKKEFPSMGQVLFETSDAREYVDKLFNFTPSFMKIIISQLDTLSYKKLAELLELESTLDALEVHEELTRRKKAGRDNIC